MDCESCVAAASRRLAVPRQRIPRTHVSVAHVCTSHHKPCMRNNNIIRAANAYTLKIGIHKTLPTHGIRVSCTHALCMLVCMHTTCVCVCVSVCVCMGAGQGYVMQ